MKQQSNIATASAKPPTGSAAGRSGAPPVETKPHIIRFVDAIVSGLTADTTLQVLDAYRSLGDRESERVYYFLQDAVARQKSPAKEAQYSPLESFLHFVTLRQTGNTIGGICKSLDLTEDQCDRYLQAWELVEAVYDDLSTYR